MSLKYFAYIRLSDDGYDESAVTQEAIIRDVASTLQINTDQLEVLFEKKSGSRGSERKKFDYMVKELRADMKSAGSALTKRKYGGIFCFKIDRLSRNDKDFAALFELLDNGYAFYSATETIENTPTGRLLFRMLGGFAIFESEKLSSRQSFSLFFKTIVNCVVGSRNIISYKCFQPFDMLRNDGFREWGPILDLNQ